MRISKRRLASILLVLATLSPALCLAASADLLAYHQILSIESEDRGLDPLPGLFLFESGPEGLVERLVLESPEGELLILTKTLLPERGLQVLTILADESGEWARLRTDMGFQASSLESFFTEAHEKLLPNSGHRVEMTLETNRTPEPVSAEVTPGFRTEGPAFVSALAKSTSAQEVAESIPPTILASRSFLLDSLSDVGGQGLTFLALLDIVGGLADLAGAPSSGGSGADGPGTTGWHQRIVRTEKGLRVEDPSLRRFLERFRHVEPAAPLADHRLLAAATAER